MRILIIVVSAWFLPGPGAAQTFTSDSGTVRFHSRVPMHAFTGTSQELRGLISLADSTLDFYLDLETLATGNGKRDRDMRRALDTANHPFAEFTGRLVGPFDPTLAATQPVVAVGRFTVNGIERDLRVDGELEPVGGDLRLTANWELSLADFEIRPPRLLVMKVSDTQRIELDITLKRSADE